MSKIFSVTEVNSYISNIFVRDGVLRRICIKGEISGCKYNSSGHIYFTLKDDKARISCALFRSSRVNLDFDLKDGQSVVCEGEISLYEQGGTYSLIVRNIELDGQGDLFAKIEELKRKLNSEGLFSADHKKAIPFYSTKIGVATARTGAAIQDILNITWRRNPHVKVYLASCKVQGEGSAVSICKALKKLDDKGLDVIIVGRGGGSIEDLMAFNEEIVARTIYDMKTPVISAVGHEIDYTICDLVSDHRAPTPSAAAEIAVCEYQAIKGNFVDIHYDMLSAINHKIDDKRAYIERLNKIIELNKPQNKINVKRMMLDNMRDRLSEIMQSKISDRRHVLYGLEPQMKHTFNRRITLIKGEMNVLAAKLDNISPLKKITSGYGYISTGEKTVRSVNDVKSGDSIEVTVTDGSLKCEVKEVESKDLWS